MKSIQCFTFYSQRASILCTPAPPQVNADFISVQTGGKYALSKYLNTNTGTLSSFLKYSNMNANTTVPVLLCIQVWILNTNTTGLVCLTKSQTMLWYHKLHCIHCCGGPPLTICFIENNENNNQDVWCHSIVRHLFRNTSIKILWDYGALYTLL